MNNRTRKDYWQHNIHIAEFWEEHCPEYSSGLWSEHEMYWHETFKIQESSSMVGVWERPSLPSLDCEICAQIFVVHEEERKWQVSILLQNKEI
jgi:hypothetical protein